MAEVVGAAAAVVQFVDVALRLSSCLERFCSDVRNVPRRFLQLQTDLRQQIEIAQQIQNHRLPGFATAVASSTFDTPLAEYVDLAEELCKTLEDLLGRKNDGALRRGWDAICSVRKKEEVANICDRLEQKKSTLSLWLEAANLKLTSSIAATTDQTQLDVIDTLTLIKTVDNTSKNIATNTVQLLPHIEQIDRTIATTSIRTESILHDTQRLLTGYNADASTRESIHQSTTMILANTEQIMAAIEKLTLTPGKHSPHAQPGYVTDRMYVGSSASQQVQQSTVNHRRRPQRCKCRTVSTARRWQPLSILRFTRTFRTQHFSYCPDYRNSEQSLEVTMQIVPPSWLLYHTIDFGTRVRNWSTMNQFSVSPIVIGTSRLVDSQMSPAFLAIANTDNELSELKHPQLTCRHPHVVAQLHNTLQRIFDDGEASALDVDSDGRTVLNVSLHS
ncbi:uncharacterized protein J4E79_007667 [Alternaria viburni]|uniref:uncharacterized protein n=1 Tax=Alternaria viburni TaxID=566460 RepID=UPI0020C21A58|nr:uncharacterized protein J4E79_007667 [Alternaria viburni]KAI4657051.1 hypothetical protein J4E79_007667 [Alternaria viburni]